MQTSVPVAEKKQSPVLQLGVMNTSLTAQRQEAHTQLVLISMAMFVNLLTDTVTATTAAEWLIKLVVRTRENT